MKLRPVVTWAACLSIGVVAFVLLHSGAAGDTACERSTFVRSSEFSAWPPGARCSFGEPEQTDVVVNEWFAAVVGVLVLFAVAQTRSSA